MPEVGFLCGTLDCVPLILRLLRTALGQAGASSATVSTPAVHLICPPETPPFEVRVFRFFPEAWERTEDHEGFKIHGRAEGVRHQAG